MSPFILPRSYTNDEVFEVLIEAKDIIHFLAYKREGAAG